MVSLCIFRSNGLGVGQGAAGVFEYIWYKLEGENWRGNKVKTKKTNKHENVEKE